MLVLVHRQKDDGYGETELFDCARNCESVFEGHRQIEHRHVNRRVLQASERLLTVAGFSDDCQLRVSLNRKAQTLAEDRVVVSDENANGGWGWGVGVWWVAHFCSACGSFNGTVSVRVVPRPGAE